MNNLKHVCYLPNNCFIVEFRLLVVPHFLKDGAGEWGK